MYAPQHVAGQGQYPPPQWSGSPNPQQPYPPHQHPGPQQPGSVYPPPSAQAASPYPPPPAGSYPPPSSYPPPPSNGYPPPAHMQQTLPSLAQDPRTDMQYRYPPHQYAPPHHMAPYPHQTAPAPRQRTAIACRYCRRRKIRCSGFEASEDGRCTNCVRFSQECIFTPVSAQTQAFVPAHTVRNYAGQYPPQQLFGAYGQPLPPQHGPPPPAGQQPPQGYPLPSPTGPYSTSGASHSPAVGAYDGREAADVSTSRKRLRDEPHTPAVAPPNPALAATQGYPDHQSSLPYRPQNYSYPEPSSLTQTAVSPASTHTPYYNTAAPPPAAHYPPPVQQQPPPARHSPTNTATPATTYDPRTSSSPNAGQAPSTPGSSVSAYPPSAYGQPAGRTPPPPNGQPPTSAANQAAANRSGLRITDMVNDEPRKQKY